MKTRSTAATSWFMPDVAGNVTLGVTFSRGESFARMQQNPNLRPLVYLALFSHPPDRIRVLSLRPLSESIRA